MIYCLRKQYATLKDAVTSVSLIDPNFPYACLSNSNKSAELIYFIQNKHTMPFKACLYLEKDCHHR